jgi:hypothetical protein
MTATHQASCQCGQIVGAVEGGYQTLARLGEYLKNSSPR